MLFEDLTKKEKEDYQYVLKNIRKLLLNEKLQIKIDNSLYREKIDAMKTLENHGWINHGYFNISISDPIYKLYTILDVAFSNRLKSNKYLPKEYTTFSFQIDIHSNKKYETCCFLLTRSK